MRGETVYVGGKPVENVLVSVGDHADEADITAPAGTVVAYTLAFPSDYPGPLHDEKVTVRGVECAVVGYCDHERPQSVFGDLWDVALCPWDMLVPVRLCAGDMSREIAVYLVEVGYDDMGDPVRARLPLYEGPAQARMDPNVGASGEGAAPDGSSPVVETWWFVIPWRREFASLRPNHAEIDMGDATYDVKSISNVDMRSEFASVKAVRHG